MLVFVPCATATTVLVLSAVLILILVVWLLVWLTTLTTLPLPQLRLFFRVFFGVYAARISVDLTPEEAADQRAACRIPQNRKQRTAVGI